ncbi:MAG: FAD binding domain-containing protein [Proteobacteria bacterium]|nr:FAD binding domain-containing protein [Pseudomonadota bacterium]
MPFGYASVSTVEDAVALLGRHGDGSKPMAGAQSLGPMLNLRLARPSMIVDLSQVAGLRQVQDEGDTIFYGAAVTHAEIEDGVVADATPGWLSAVARRIAYRAVRNRGTIGGSLAHADPAADWVNVMTALGGAVELAASAGRRRVALSDFFLGPFATALGPDEIIAGVRIAKRRPSARWGYWKFCRKVGDFAEASAAVLIDPARGETRILIGAIERPPAFVVDPDGVLSGRRSVADAVAEAAPGLSDVSFALHVAAVRRAMLLAEPKGHAAR